MPWRACIRPLGAFRKIPWGSVFVEWAGWRGATKEVTRGGLRLRSNKARRSVPLKPSGRRFLYPRPALTRSSQPAAGMLQSRRLGYSQNPSPQHSTQFSDRLLGSPHHLRHRGRHHQGAVSELQIPGRRQRRDRHRASAPTASPSAIPSARVKVPRECLRRFTARRFEQMSRRKHPSSRTAPFPLGIAHYSEESGCQ